MSGSENDIGVQMIEMHADPDTIAKAIMELVDQFGFYLHRTSEQYPRYILLDRKLASSGRDDLD